MKIKLNMPVSLLLVAAFVLSACGAEATPTATPAVATEPPPATEAPATEVPAVKFTIWTEEAYVAVLEGFATAALEKYNLELVVEAKTDLAGEFTSAAPAGTGPDIVLLSHDQVGALIADELLAEVVLGNNQTNFNPKAISACTIDGKLYCLPYAMENPGFLYNTSLVSTPPTTWDEVITLGSALKADGKVDFAMSITGATVELYPLFSSFGGYVFGKNADGSWNKDDLGLQNEGMTASLAWLGEQVANGNLPNDWDAEKNRVLFETGKTPFIIDGPASLSRYSQAGVSYGIAAFPGGGAPFAKTLGFFVNAKSSSTLLASAFLNEYIATEETMIKLYEAGQRMPAHTGAAAKVDNADLKAFAEIGANADMLPNIAAMNVVWDSWAEAVGLVKDGKKDAETALKEAGEKIRVLIENPLAGMVNVQGNYQFQLGCEGDWQADCDITAMTEGEDGKWHSGPFALLAGEYEANVALDGKADTNYGVDGVAGGENYTFSLAANGTVEFIYDPTTHVLEIVVK